MDNKKVSKYIKNVSKRHSLDPSRSMHPSDNKSIRSNERVNEAVAKEIPLHESGLGSKETYPKPTCGEKPSFPDYMRFTLDRILRRE